MGRLSISRCDLHNFLQVTGIETCHAKGPNLEESDKF